MPPKRGGSHVPPSNVPRDDDMNEAYLELYFKAVETKYAHPEFKDMRQKQPKGIKEGGHADPYDKQNTRWP